MAAFDPRLLTPPQEEEEIHPYRRAWRSIAIEAGLLLGLTTVLFVLTSFLGFQLPARFHTPINVLLTLFPLALWMMFSWWPERFVPQPRQHLLVVVVVSALVANAVGIPLINGFFQVERWLPLGGAIDRILGYTFTIGIVQSFLQYLVVRYTVWPNCFRNRLDSVAYGAACAVGYTSVLNLHYVLANTPSPDATTLRILDTVVLSLVTNLLVGYGLAELRFGTPSPLILTITVGLSAFVIGFAIPVRAGLVNAALSLPGENAVYSISWLSTTRPLFGLGFSTALLIGFALVLGFLFNSSERREREAASREV